MILDLIERDRDQETGQKKGKNRIREKENLDLFLKKTINIEEENQKIKKIKKNQNLKSIFRNLNLDLVLSLEKK